jgi:heme exporter protein A
MHNAAFAQRAKHSDMLELNDVTCVRGERTLFSAVTFSVEGSTVLRIGGANGTGKTSLLRIICGLMLPLDGEVHWRGENIRTLREEYWKDLVYVGHVNAVKDDLTAAENLRIGAALGGRSVDPRQALEALDMFGIAACAPLPARVLSQGQRRRVALARVVTSKDAPLWILDEPFTALDAAAVELMQHLIEAHVSAGGTTILTTHQEVALAAPVQRRIDLGAC